MEMHLVWSSFPGALCTCKCLYRTKSGWSPGGTAQGSPEGCAHLEDPDSSLGAPSQGAEDPH